MTTEKQTFYCNSTDWYFARAYSDMSLSYKDFKQVNQRWYLTPLVVFAASAIGSIILNLALLAIGIGVGVLGGAALEGAGMDSDVSFPASIFIFGGVGLVISFFINRKLDKE